SRRRRCALPAHPRGSCSPEALAEQVGHLDEYCAAVAAKAGYELPAKAVVAIVIQIVVVPDIQSGARVGSPSEQELALVIRVQGIVINSSTRKDEARELIRRSG